MLSTYCLVVIKTDAATVVASYPDFFFMFEFEKPHG